MAASAASGTDGQAGELIVVGPGDTLWGLVRRYGPADVDPRLRVHELRQHNALSSALLQVGQFIELPPAWSAGDSEPPLARTK